MDIVSHGLWGGIAFGRKNRVKFWLSFIFGILPDLIAFGGYFLMVFLRLTPPPNFGMGAHPPVTDLPEIVYSLYDFSHSLIIFALIFFVLWLIFRRPVWESLAWPTHIVFDIFTHSADFFPTPFLWPVSNFQFSGINWSAPIIFIPNVSLLIILYIWFFVWKRRKV